MSLTKNTPCLWKRVMLDPNSTSSKDASVKQQAKCKTCGGTPNCCQRVDCQKYLADVSLAAK